jgi:pyridoxine kinase
MGDVGRGMFVLPGVPELIRERVVPAADVLTPNAFELSYLAFGGAPGEVDPDRVGPLEALLAAVDAVRAMGPRTVLVTSVQGSVVEPGQIGLLAVDDSGAYLVRTPELPLSVNGAGDVTAALFLAHLRDGISTALARIASSVFGILAATHSAGTREIALIAAQDVIADPPAEFAVEQVR